MIYIMFIKYGLVTWAGFNSWKKKVHSEFIITHRKYTPPGAVKHYTVDWREVAKNAFMYLHVLVRRSWEDLAETSCACRPPSAHGGHFT